MSTRPRRALLALAAAGSVLLSGVTLSSPAEAATQSVSLSVYGPVNENVKFVAAAGVTPVKVGRVIELQAKDGKRWKTIAKTKQDQWGGVSFYPKLKRTKAAKASKGYENRYVRVRARKSGSLKEKIGRSQKVKLYLDPKVYYKVVRASVQHTETGFREANGCNIGASFSATRKTDSGLGKAETGKPKWRAIRTPNGTIKTELNPKLGTRWTQELNGCRYQPMPATTCSTTRVETPSGDGKQGLGVRVSVPKSGNGSVLFYTRGLSVGFPSADDSVCNVPWLQGGEVPVKVRTKSVSRKTLLGKKPFTIVNQGQASWKTSVIDNRPADLDLHWTESITLQRVDASGRTLR